MTTDESPAPKDDCDAEETAPLNCASLIENGWFMEKNSQWPGQANSLQVEEILLHTKTKFQDLMVFRSTTWGKVLVLDGVIQLTERDEMSYQEMMAHLPLFSHPNPKTALVVGGGDGGVLREVCKHTCLESITMCEIDEGVVNASKQFFPSVSVAFGSPRTNLIIADAVGYVENAEENSIDVIIVDSSDPVGPAEKLFSAEFYRSALRALTPGGVICSQGECLWVHMDLIAEMLKSHGAPFASAEYASVQVPTYPSGQIGAFLARKGDGSGGDASCRRPRRAVPDDMELRYYTEDMHVAAFALPAFLARKLSSAATDADGEPPEKRQRTA